MKEAIVKNDLLFHAVHGLCRVTAVVPQAQSRELGYSLLPVSSNRAKIRFMIPESSLENSGFNKLISTKEADAILDYFKTGEREGPECSQAWDLAVLIRTESCNKEPVKDGRKRQKLEHSVKGLAGELAFVLEKTLKEIAERIQRNLGSIPKINPFILSTLVNIAKD